VDSCASASRSTTGRLSRLSACQRAAEVLLNARLHDHGAHQLRLEDKIGSLQAGKHADIIVLGENLFAVMPEAIHAVAVRMTMMDGRITHDARA
jgi:predicted amidohydrolase YtcJ